MIRYYKDGRHVEPGTAEGLAALAFVENEIACGWRLMCELRRDAARLYVWPADANAKRERAREIRRDLDPMREVRRILLSRRPYA